MKRYVLYSYECNCQGTCWQWATLLTVVGDHTMGVTVSPGCHAERGTRARMRPRGSNFVTICWALWLPLPAIILAQVQTNSVDA